MSAGEKKGILNRIKSWCATGFVPVPVGRWEWFLMRLFFAMVAFNEFWDWHPFAYTTQDSPVGIAKLINLTWLQQPWVYPAVQWISAIGLIAYVAGLALPVTLPVLTTVHILMRTYENSQGSIHHSHQIVTFVLLAQSIVVLWAWIRKARGKPWPFAEEISVRSLCLYYTQGAVAATYVVAALSKAINSKLMWVWNSPYLAYDMVKSHRVTYYRYLEDEYADEPVIAQWIFDHPWISRLAFGWAFWLELLALVALRNRAWAFWTGLALIALHRSIYLTMHIRFDRNELLLLIFFVNLPFWHYWMSRKCDGDLIPSKAVQD